jgi:peptidoglycan-N-acetylmuramic acid deacetylase
MGKTKNNNKKKQKRNLIRLLIIIAVLFFTIGFCISYVWSVYRTKKDLTNEPGNYNNTEKTDDIILEDDEGNDKLGDKTTIENNEEKEKEDKESKEEATNNESNGKKPDTPVPTNPPTPNVEKLNVNILEKLDNKKFSWWIRLNKEHKPPTTNEDIEKLIDKYDGIYLGDTSQKVIYLTFDEGYENGYTPQILDTLKENDVKTIFFVTSSYVKNNPELVKRMLDEGHQVGNHTINHPSLPDLGYEKLENELLGLEKEFYEQFQVGFKYMRPPAGEYSERVLAAAQQLGYKTVFWSFAYDDWYADKIRGADYAYNKVMENLHNGAVLLLHAVSKDNADALDRIIKDIRAEGYEIRAFDL